MNPGATEASPVDAHQEWHAPHNPWLITFVATLATFMEVLDTTIVNVALPHIAGNLGADVADGTWTLTSYLVANAVVLPLSSWFSSLMGRKNYYLVCVCLFTVSSLLCGLAPSLELLVLFRLFQGIGGGGLQPSSQAILVDTFPPHMRGMGMAAFGMTIVTAPVIGPTLGGWITDNFSWRWIFLINVPVGLLALMLTSRFISDPPYLPRRRGPGRFRADYIGFLLLAVGLGGVQLTLDIGERNAWFDSSLIVSLAVLGALGLVAAAWWELRHDDAMFKLRLLRERNLGMAALMMFLFGVILYGSTTLLPVFMQTLLGYTALLSGLAISPGAVATLCVLPLVGFLLSRMDARWLVTAGAAFIFTSLWMMSGLNLTVDFWTIVRARAVQALGFGFVFVPINTVAYAYVAREFRNDASSLVSVARNLGGSIGIAVAISYISRLTQVHQGPLVSHLTPYDPGFMETLRGVTTNLTAVSGDPVRASQQAYAIFLGMARGQAASLAFMDVFAAFMVLIALVVPAVWWMKRPPHEIR